MEKYVKVKKIGEGSFGKAVLVKSKEDGMQYVVKEISISKMQPKERQEARKEVSVLSKMRHPNIVHYVESFEESGCLYIVMEYCEGGDLYASINAQRGMAFSEGKVLDWFIQICLALKHVHDRKILHRDIKTSNIFLTKSGSIKLGDFGIARVLNNTLELARTCIGTPYYLSPEICENKPYNNKSDVWALGCVLYEVLTLKHAFEAGNMKNLVLKIIRGSYPPVHSRYSYDLRSLVGQLFRRNPRDRPSVNSILRQSFIRKRTERFLTPEQHEDEFSHTVLHKNRKPPRPSSAAAAYKRPEVKPKMPLKSPVDGRARQIAGVYGQPVAGKRPVSAASRYHRYAEQQKKMQSDLEKKKQQFIEGEKKRREISEKKQQNELALRQMERANRIRAEQIRRARENARQLNLKRSADIFDAKKETDENQSPVQIDNVVPIKQPRPTSAPSQAQPQKYDKYHEYLNKLGRGDKLGAAEMAAPKLAQVKEAWNERVNAQNAVMEAIGNKVEGKMAADRVRVANDFWQRKQEAEENKKNQGQIIVHGERVGIARALRPQNEVPQAKYNQIPAKNKDEEEYLARLRQIRIQNFNERRALKEKLQGRPYKVISAEEEANKIRQEKLEALQKQAEERARIVQENIEARKRALIQKAVEPDLAVMHAYEEKARARGIVPPDERRVKYNPLPIGITQALHAVGIENKESDPPRPEPEKKEEALFPQAAVVKPELRKNILKRINQKFKSSEDDEEGEKSSEPVVRKAWGAKNGPDKAPGQLQWAGGDIGLKLAALPLEETLSQLEATSYDDIAIMNQAKNIVAKRGWNLPSNTVVKKLNQLSLCDPSLTVPPDVDQECKDAKDVKRNDTEDQSKNDADAPTVLKLDSSPTPRTPRPLPPAPGRSQSPIKFTVNLDPTKKKSPTLLAKVKADPPSENAPTQKNTVVRRQPAGGTVVLGDLSAATLEETPEIIPPTSNMKQNHKSPLVAALAAKFDSGMAKGSFVVGPNDKHAAPITEGKGEPVVTDDKQQAKILKEITSKLEVQMNEEEVNNIQEIKLEEESDREAKAKKQTKAAWSVQSKSEVVRPTNPPLPGKIIEPKQASPTQKTEEGSSSTQAEDKAAMAMPSPEKTASLISPAELSSSLGSITTPRISNEEPLFTKAPRTPVTSSTLPINNQNSSPSSPSKLSKTMYATASSEMVLKITMGHFDSPNPKLLRTCSLPDLMRAIPENGNSNPSKHASPARKSLEDIKVTSIESSAASSPSTPPPSPNALNLEASSISMNDTNFDEDETRPGSSQDMCNMLEEEDDDLASLRANLENVLLEDDGSHGFSSDDEQEVNRRSDEDEAWESDEDGSSSPRSDASDDVSDTESVFSRLEANREQLEAELGFIKFMKVYKYVQAIHEDEDEEMKDGERKIQEILGSKHDRLYPRILQLVMADGAYCEDNN